MPTLQRIANVLERIQSADITARQQRCVSVRNRNAGCTRCADACTSGAIAIVDNELVIAPELCIGCGTCATMCPTCALEAHQPNDEELLNAVLEAVQANDNVAVIACRQIVDAAAGMVDADKIVALECLGRVEESLLLACAECGIQQVVLVQAECASCDHAVGIQTTEKVIETTRVLADAWDIPLNVKLAQKFPSSVRAAGQTYDKSRRNFFFQMREEGVRVVGAVADEVADNETDVQQPNEQRYVSVTDDGTLPHFIPDRRERLLDSLASFGDPKDTLVETRLWGHVVIDAETCSGCRMCAVFCPTGALMKFDGENGEIGIDHYPGDCVNCSTCENICPTKALHLRSDVLADDLLSGRVEHNIISKPDIDVHDPKRGMKAMRRLVGFSEIYER